MEGVYARWTGCRGGMSALLSVSSKGMASREVQDQARADVWVCTYVHAKGLMVGRLNVDCVRDDGVITEVHWG